ncbi:unnamed protein product [Toxocara canis]|uniref:Secreted protein n=1 Tax=Toxocara canis TaxID=6265 RepID=A0A183V4U1_TOXCA|nr:unnamed protein product [Toxocara canis]
MSRLSAHRPRFQNLCLCTSGLWLRLAPLHLVPLRRRVGRCPALCCLSGLLQNRIPNRILLSAAEKAP